MPYRGPHRSTHSAFRDLLLGLSLGLFATGAGAQLMVREGAQAGPSVILPLQDWKEPPREYRPIARWWWPGGSVHDEKLRAHLGLISRAGFGAVEVQPLLLGLGADDVEADARLRTVGKADFFSKLAEAARAAHANRLEFDLTLGSGWPGGLPISPSSAERQLLMGTDSVSGPSRYSKTVPLPSGSSYRDSVEWILDVLGPPDPELERVTVLAAQIVGERGGVPVLGEVRDLSEFVKGDRLDWDVPAGPWRMMAFYSNSTSHFVMGGAYPGREEEARVIDHLSSKGADALLDGYAVPAVKAIGAERLRGIFVDSFELMGELPFTADFAEAFQSMKGYDLIPHLPVLFVQGGESKYSEMMDLFGQNGGPRYVYPDPEKAERIREDYESVRQALFEEAFIGRLAEWSARHGVNLRLQAHGGYGDDLDTYALADIPESEALFAGGSADFLKLASSAAHVAGRRWASSESFITLQTWKTRLSDPEMRLLAGRAYASGINQLVFHGVPYPYRRADGSKWYPFPGGFGRVLAGPLPMSSEIDEEALEHLPRFNQFLSRLSLAMSQGVPTTEVAWLKSESQFPDAPSIEWGRVDPGEGESQVAASLRRRGLGYDRVSRKMLSRAEPLPGGAFRVGAQIYRFLLLDPLESAEPKLVHSIAALVASGIPVAALGALPQRAPGWHDASRRDKSVRESTAQWAGAIFQSLGREDVGGLVRDHVQPEFLALEDERGESSISLTKRKTDAGDITLLFNESWSEESVQVTLTRGGSRLTLWDPWTGEQRVLAERPAAGERFEIEVGPAESWVLTMAPAGSTGPEEAGAVSATLDSDLRGSESAKP